MTRMIGRLAAGAVAGALGTVAMDLVWYTRYRSGGGEDGFLDWEFATSTSSFEAAAAPGTVAAKLAGAVGVELPDDAAGTTTNALHWVTAWGAGSSTHWSTTNVGPCVAGW